MKLVLKDGKKEVEVSEIKGIDKDSEVLIFFLNRHVTPEFIRKMIDYIEYKTQKTVIVLPFEFSNKVYGL